MLNPRRAPFLLSLTSLGLFCVVTMAQTARFEPLGDLPGGITGSLATDVSGDGSVVVGIGNFFFGPNLTGQEAFRWTQTGGMVGLGDLPGGPFISQANAVSADGATVVGRSFSSKGFEAFQWRSGTGMVGLGDLPGGIFWSGATGVSADGSVIVGQGAASTGNEPFRWSVRSGMVGLGHLPGGGGFFSSASAVSADGSIVVGMDTIQAGITEAFVWSELQGMRGLGDLPGGKFTSIASAVSPDGSIIVGVGASAQGGEAFKWTESSGMIGLGELAGGGFLSFAHDVSADGSVVVGRSVTAVFDEAFIWDELHGMRNLREVLIDEFGVDLSGWLLIAALGVSEDGHTIVGWAFNPQGNDEAWIARLPRLGRLGDMNCDGAFNGADIEPFFLALGDPVAYAGRFPGCDILNGDINTDGALNGGDIDPFFRCLGGGSCP